MVVGVGMDYGLVAIAARQAIDRHGLRYEALVLGGNRREPCALSQQVGPVGFYPTSYLYDPAGHPAAYIPGPLSKARMLSFMAAHEGHGLAQAGGGSRSREPVAAFATGGADRRC